VLPYFPYSRQSKKKSHRGAITARMLANLLDVAGVKHVITVDLHASQMQGFFRCPVDNLHAEPLIARWIRHNVPNWREAVVVSKNAGGTKRVTSLADALKLNFGMVTTDKRRGNVMTASMVLNDEVPLQCLLDGEAQNTRSSGAEDEQPRAGSARGRPSRIVSDSQGSPRRVNGPPVRTTVPPRSPYARPRTNTGTSQTSAIGGLDEEMETDDADFNDQRAHDVTHGRLVHGHIVPDDFPSPALSAADASVAEEDPMTMSHASSFFQPSDPHALGGSGEDNDNSDDEEIITNSKVEHMITLVGDVKNRTVLIVDDMIDKPGSWIAAAETVVKRGLAKKVYCIATHGIFGGDSLEQMQACDCIDTIVVTNSYPVPENRQRASSKLVLLDLSYLLGEAIRRNHYGESISPLFQHIVD
jgi:ribose-phosphate pyrophosphokinase